ELLMDAREVDEALESIASQIDNRHPAPEPLVLVGIQTGGAALAKRLAAAIQRTSGREVPVGLLDIAMHRDDLSRRLAPPIHPTSIPCDVEGKTVVLVDDVLFSGRTGRAALDALTDLGRPRLVELAVLIDRGHRELPIHADYIGRRVETRPSERVEALVEEDGLAVYLCKDNGSAPAAPQT
ncbi:MAG: bifunctional pyr operon transcriptional regulator/uracil phosphoribosyltransferase PyrR, partial [Verrucomicrobia bacterium]|nr:bifunctional pyr operon transcriptional regulator/uracil phosphoribosyltransferase PyrR [Verrucomicrobiota bacterium]